MGKLLEQQNNTNYQKSLEKKQKIWIDYSAQRHLISNQKPSHGEEPRTSGFTGELY